MVELAVYSDVNITSQSVGSSSLASVKHAASAYCVDYLTT